MPFLQKLLFSLPVFLLIHSTCLGQKDFDAKDIITWRSNRPLQFTDFKGKPPYSELITENDSTIVLVDKIAGISKSISVDLETNRSGTRFTINAEMLTTSSWFKKAGDSLALKHEQAHFDIAEIHARMLRKEIRAATSIAKAKSVYDNVLKRESAMQKAFDRDNTYLLGGVTREWQIKISDQLKALSAFTNPVVFVPVTQ